MQGPVSKFTLKISQGNKKKKERKRISQASRLRDIYQIRSGKE